LLTFSLPTGVASGRARIMPAKIRLGKS